MGKDGAMMDHPGESAERWVRTSGGVGGSRSVLPGYGDGDLGGMQRIRFTVHASEVL